MLFSNEVIAEWLKTKESEVKRSSFSQYKRITQIIVNETTDINYICELDGQKLYERLLLKYSLTTIRSVFTITNQILMQGYFNTEKKISFKAKSAQKRSVTVLTIKEQTALTQFLLKEMDPSKFGVLLCLYTGLRLGEVCGLRWEDFNIKRKSFYIRRTIQRIGDRGTKSFFSIDTPKTDTSIREIPFPPPLQGIIVLMYKKQSKDNYIASGSCDFIQPRTYQNRLKAYFRKCGLPEYHFHTLRHTFASRAIELGFDVKSLSEILGHASIKTTLELYTHPSLESKAKEMKKFSKFIKNTTQN